MSGEGEDVVVAPASMPESAMDKMTALGQVLKDALCADGLARGLREAAKALDKKAAHFCVLANDFSDCDAYPALIEALCSEHSIPLIQFPDGGAKLGELAGLCKIDAEGNAKSVRKCMCVVVTDWGRESNASAVLQESFAK